MKVVTRNKIIHFSKDYTLKTITGILPIRISFHLKDPVTTFGSPTRGHLIPKIDCIIILLSEKQIMTKVKMLVLKREEYDDINLLPFIKEEIIDSIQQALRSDLDRIPHIKDLDPIQLELLSTWDIRTIEC